MSDKRGDPMGEAYPAAPTKAAERQKWMTERNAMIAEHGHAVALKAAKGGSIGAGKLTEPKGKGRK